MKLFNKFKNFINDKVLHKQNEKTETLTENKVDTLLQEEIIKDNESINNNIADINEIPAEIIPEKIENTKEIKVKVPRKRKIQKEKTNVKTAVKTAVIKKETVKKPRVNRNNDEIISDNVEIKKEEKQVKIFKKPRTNKEEIISDESEIKEKTVQKPKTIRNQDDIISETTNTTKKCKKKVKTEIRRQYTKPNIELETENKIIKAKKPELIDDTKFLHIVKRKSSVKETLPKIKEQKTVNIQENKKQLINIQKTDKKIYKSSNKKYDKIVIFLTPGHTNKTPGKHSPDGRLYEWKYNRMIVERIEKKLDELGIEHWNSHPEDSWVDNTHNNDNKDLQLRVQRINKKYEEVKKQGKTAIMLSVHVNAAGNGGWYNATGWSAWTTKGQNNSDKLANELYNAAEELLKPLGKKLRYDLSDGDKDFESNFYVIKHVNCIAVLTENFFMDNIKDVDWLLSLQGQEYISLVHVEGIKKYIEKYIK